MTLNQMHDKLIQILNLQGLSEVVVIPQITRATALLLSEVIPILQKSFTNEIQKKVDLLYSKNSPTVINDIFALLSAEIPAFEEAIIFELSRFEEKMAIFKD